MEPYLFRACVCANAADMQRDINSRDILMCHSSVVILPTYHTDRAKIHLRYR